MALGSYAETIASLLGGGAVTTDSGGVLTLDSAADSSFLGTISGGGGIAKFGSGTLRLSGTNTYAGGTDISEGVLEVAADHNLGTSTSDIIFDGGILSFLGSFPSSRTILLDSHGGTLDTDGSNVTWNGMISGSGPLTKTGDGSVTLTNANLYTGATTINHGVLQVSDSTALGTADGGTTVNANGELELIGSSALEVTEPLILHGGILCNGNSNTSSYSGSITLTADSWIDADAGTLVISSAIGESGGSFGLTKDGPGVVELNHANTYTGITSINIGILRISDPLSLGTSVGGTIVHTGGELELYGEPLTLNEPLTVNEPLTLNGGTICSAIGTNTYSGAILLTASSELDADSTELIITGGIGESGGNYGLTKVGPGIVKLTAVNTYTGLTDVRTGTLSLSNGAAIADTGAVLLADAASAMLQLNASETIGSLAGGGPNGGNIQLAANTLTVGNSANTHFGGVISGQGGSLTKEGAGVLILSGVNTYTGNTTLKAGTLALEGDSSIASANLIVGDAGSSGTVLDVAALNSDFTIVTGQRLSGIGTVDANDGNLKATVTIAGTHAPGNGLPGKQTFDGDLTYAANSVFEWTLASTPTATEITDDVDYSSNRGTGYAAVNVTGTLGGADAVFRIVLAGTQDFSGTFWNSNRMWTDIFRTADGTASSNQDIAALFGGGFEYYNAASQLATPVNGSFSLSGSTLTWAAVPEPSSALAALILGSGLLRRKRL